MAMLVAVAQLVLWIQELRAVPALFRLPHEFFQKIVAMSLQDGRAQESPETESSETESSVATGASWRLTRARSRDLTDDHRAHRIARA